MERYTGDITPIEFRPGCIHRPSDATSFGYEADMMMENTLRLMEGRESLFSPPRLTDEELVAKARLP